MARVFLTGATGFIGRHAAPALLAAGHEVHALVRPASRREGRMRRLEALGVAPVEGDLRDVASLDARFEGFECVVHLGATVDPAEQVDARLVQQVNEEAPVELALLARARGVSRFVFMSSIAAMGFRSGLATPTSPCAPVTAYGRAKLGAERRLHELADERFSVVTLRPPTVHGPGERYNFLAFVRAVDRGRFRVIGDGENVFPLCAVANASLAIVAAASGSVPGGVHLLADDARYPMKRVHEAIAAALGRRAPRVHLPRAAAWAAGWLNERLSSAFGAPLVLSRARVRTLTVDQPFDVGSLRSAGVALSATLEADVRETVAEQRASGALRSS